MIRFRPVREARTGIVRTKGPGCARGAAWNRRADPRTGFEVTSQRSLSRIPIPVVILFLLAGCGGGPAPAPPPYTTPMNAQAGQFPPEVDAYRITVGDELRLTVLGDGGLSGPVRVLPDGTVTVPAAGPVYVLGMTVAEATAAIREAIGRYVRYPDLTVGVVDFGARRVFLMGEVDIPGDHEYHRGMSVLGAIAQAGGFNDRAKRSSVMVFRRLGPEEVIAHRVDLTGPLKGEDLGQDIPIRPLDIVYVPKTFIASVNVLMDQYFRQLTPPFTLYIDGWQALHMDETNTRFVTR
ncbi:MAG: hypothetical protein GF346_13475 [Candidatus Eisenbacteria bacterium]|nr:hypothetical protein [Candidatus Latescibacterota bacterium]MBD3303451.1 hypothetical protein [Candidatus Eisenbacteria bacterium]